MSPADLEPLALTARDVAVEWGLELGPPFALSRFSYVAPAGDDAVLKVSPVEDDESGEEAAALELWNGDGAVRLLRRDRERRALLIERVRPGTNISELRDDEATAIAVALGLRLWRPAGEPFRWIGDHVPGWLDQAERSRQDGMGARPAGARALRVPRRRGRTTLVHGDFHHHNILRSGSVYLAIDPKPMLGRPSTTCPRSCATRCRTRCASMSRGAGWRRSPTRVWTRSGCGRGRSSGSHSSVRRERVRVARALV